MAEFDALFDCTLGSTSFQLRDYGYKHKPIVEEGKGQTGVEIQIDGEGWVEADTAANFEAALVATAAGFRVSGQDFILTSLSGITELSVAAAQCLDGGPFVAFEILPQGGGARLVKDFKFTLTARQAKKSDNDNDEPTHTYKIKIVTRPDGLRRVTVSGELKGVNGSGFFNSVVLGKFGASYPVASWVPTITYEGNQKNDSATYSLEYKELDETLPTPARGTAVDGTATDSTERDEQLRLVRTLSFDFLCVGDPMVLRDFMRGLLPATPFKERFEVTRYDEVRARGEFQLLTGGNGNDLMNWERSIAPVIQQQATYEVFAIPGAAPVFVQQPQHGFQYTDSGRAIGAGRFPREPDPVYPTFAAPGETTFTDLNTVEKQTSWKYVYLFDKPIEDLAGVLVKLARPENPGFYGKAPS